MTKKKLSGKFWGITFLFAFVFIVFILVGFYFFAKSKEKVVLEEENGGTVLLNYTTEVPELELSDLSYVNDDIGKKILEPGKYFDFSIDTSLDNAPFIEYEIAVLKNSSYSNISDKDIKIYLEQEKNGSFESVFDPSEYVPLKVKTKFNSPVGSMVLYNGKSKKKATSHFRLRMWVSNNKLTSLGNYGITVLVNGK